MRFLTIDLHYRSLGKILYIIFSRVVVFNFMLEHFELVKCPLCSSFCCVLLIFLYGIKGCFLSKIYGLNILLNQHPTLLSSTHSHNSQDILISLKTQEIYYKIQNKSICLSIRFFSFVWDHPIWVMGQSYQSLNSRNLLQNRRIKNLNNMMQCYVKVW